MLQDHIEIYKIVCTHTNQEKIILISSFDIMSSIM